MFRSKQPAVVPHSSKRIEITMRNVREIMEQAYFVHRGTFDPARIEGGYAFDVFGTTDGSYWRDSQEVAAPDYRVHIKVNSDPARDSFKPGVIGGGQLHKNYAEIELSLDPAFVRDILYELRRDSRRELRVAGDTISDDRFLATLFMLSAPSA